MIAPHEEGSMKSNDASRGMDKSIQENMEIDLSDVALSPTQGQKPSLRRSDTSPNVQSNSMNTLDWDPPEIWSGHKVEPSSAKQQLSVRNSSQVEDISPWTLSHSSSVARQNTSETNVPTSSSSFSTASHNIGLHRSSTPPSLARDSPNSTPQSVHHSTIGKRSRNPLSFFRKRPSTAAKDETAFSMPINSSLRTLPTLTSLPSGSTPQVYGLDEDLDELDREAGKREKRKTVGRPKLREKESSMRKAKAAAGESWDPGPQDEPPSGVVEEIPLALDTNFDHMEDIVNPSFRSTSLVGPMNEGLSPQATPVALQPPQTILHSPTSKYIPRERAGSVTFAEHARSQTTHSDSHSSQRRPGVKRLGSVGAGISSESLLYINPSSSSTDKSATSSPGPSSQRSSLRKMSKAEAQLMMAKQTNKGVNDRFWPNSDSLAPPIRSNVLEMKQPFLDSFSVAAADSRNISARDDRKASIASESSRMTSGSGISPTTSISNLPKTNRDTHDSTPAATPTNEDGSTTDHDNGNSDSHALLDGSYRFPAWEKNTSSSAEGPRKSSASSGKVKSSWMAPDSWAVQEGKIRDALRDGDDEEEEEEEEEKREEERSTSITQNRAFSTTSSGVGLPSTSTKSGSLSSSVTSPHATSNEGMRDSSISGRRGTIDSNMSANSANGFIEASNSQSDDSALEVLAAAHPNGANIGDNLSSSGSPYLGGASMSRPTNSRSHALGGAAAAAAGKLGLHRPSRIKLTPRPNTAGAGALGQGGSGRNSASTPTKEADGFGLWKSKRPSTATAHSGTRLIYLRIYRNDNTHSVITIPLTATAADLRVVIARKSMDATAKRLFVRDKGSERPLGESEKPAMLQRRRLEQAGYTDHDNLDELGREDWSFLLKFVYRPDSVTKFESDSFGSTEPDFNRLDLQNRNLEMVPIFLYRYADWIQSLDLSGNPMSDLPLDFVQLCSNMTTLRLSNLSLKRIPQSIRQAARLTHLDLSDNRIPELSHITLSDILLMSLKVQNNRLPELPQYFGGMHSLRDLNISNNRFEVFPSIICQLPNLLQLDISFNAIAELPYELGDMVNLQRLVLVGNMLVKLPTCIHKLVNLHTLDLRRNLLQDVSELFALPKLQILQCEHNSIKHLSATFGVHLKTLEIGQNPLSKATFVAQDICALTSLNLSSANMGRLDEEVLSRLPNLTHLVLDKNTLVVLPDNLGHLSHLRKLSCSNNLLATLPDSIGKLDKLEELQVHNNNLKTLPSSIWSCSKLHSINVSSNLLESFPEPQMVSVASTNSYFDGPPMDSSIAIQENRKGSATSLIPLTPSGLGPRHVTMPLSVSLIRLRVGDNRLTEEIFDVLGHLQNLKILNLSCNEIYELPNYGLSKHIKLEELYLSGNYLSSIPADVLPLLQEMRILHLNGNKLQTLPAEIGKMSNLVNLDVGNNSLKYNISNQQYDWNWNSNPHLRYLNLSGNKRLEIKSNPVLVNASDTRANWKRTDSSDFQRLADLRLLGLMDVTVTLHQMPDQFEDRRVRTSLSQINQMAYGISDALGKHEHLSIIDVVIPRFRKVENECIFGLFAGRGHGHKSASRIAYHLAEWVQFRVQWEIQRLQSSHNNQQVISPEPETVADILRRAFLRMQKEYADILIIEGSRKKASKDDKRMDGPAFADFQQASHWKSGASAVLSYVINRTLFIANVGDALAVLCRNSQAILVSTRHEPFDRNETLRIRSAEGWVSLTGQVNGKLDVSRSFGYYHLAPIVNAAPAVTQIDLTDSDEFIILANRTLWDVISYQTAVDIARMERDDPMLAAQKLRDFAISYGAEDSIMIMIVAVGDIFEKARTGGRSGNATFGGNNNLYGSLNEPVSGGYDVEGFKKVAPRRAREDRDLPGDRTLARLQREVAPPIGQVALVFTDIKNSTALWETNGGMQSSMRLHNFLLRRQLRNIGGYEVKTEGDAFMVSFQNVTAALLWCFQVQIQLLKENWPQELLESEDGKETYDEETGELLHRGLSVRMGIHWGWPVCEADPITRRMDYFGPMVNRASRISGAADGGQILASRDVVNELRAIMGTFDDDSKNRESNGDDAKHLNEQGDPDELEKGNVDEEEAYRLLHPNVSRDVILLRRMGFAISDIGERRLKGLEIPEFLNLVYPKSLTRRNVKVLQTIAGVVSIPSGDAKAGEGPAQIDDADKLKIIQAPHEVFEPTMQLLNIDEIRLLGYVCLRLESLAQGKVFKGIEEVAAEGMAFNRTMVTSNSTTSTLSIANSNEARISRLASISLPAVSQLTISLPTPDSRQMVVEAYINRHPELSMYSIRDDATDDELHTVLQELVGRICVALSSLALRRHLCNRSMTIGWNSDIFALIDSLSSSNLFKADD